MHITDMLSVSTLGRILIYPLYYTACFRILVFKIESVPSRPKLVTNFGYVEIRYNRKVHI